MNIKGKAFGLALILILIVAIIVAYLTVTQMRALRIGKKEETQQQAPVQQVQDVVDQINQRQKDAAEEP